LPWGKEKKTQGKSAPANESAISGWKESPRHRRKTRVGRNVRAEWHFLAWKFVHNKKKTLQKRGKAPKVCFSRKGPQRQLLRKEGGLFRRGEARRVEIQKRDLSNFISFPAKKGGMKLQFWRKRVMSLQALLWKKGPKGGDLCKCLRKGGGRRGLFPSGIYGSQGEGREGGGVTMNVLKSPVHPAPLSSYKEDLGRGEGEVGGRNDFGGGKRGRKKS